MVWHSLPRRNLERAELEALVGEVACRPETWLAHIAFGEEHRYFTSLYRDDYLDVWLICWRRVDDTGWHDHDVSSGAVHVVEGALRESTLRLGGEPGERIVPAGRSFAFGPDHIHRLCGQAGRSVSLHAYSPPLCRLGQYAVDDNGVLRRVSVSYAEELRPLGEPLAA